MTPASRAASAFLGPVYYPLGCSFPTVLLYSVFAPMLEKIKRTHDPTDHRRHAAEPHVVSCKKILCHHAFDFHIRRPHCSPILLYPNSISSRLATPRAGWKPMDNSKHGSSITSKTFPPSSRPESTRIGRTAKHSFPMRNLQSHNDQRGTNR